MNRNRLQILLDPKKDELPTGPHFLEGLGKEDIEELLKMCSFKDMKSPEYGYGIIPTVLYNISETRLEYSLHEVEIKGKVLFVMIDEDRSEKYISLIEEWAESNSTKHYHGIADVVNGVTLEEPPQGWIDIDQEAVIFVNEEMAMAFDKWLVIVE